MDIRDVFARNLRRIRHEKGLSQEELAVRANLDRTYISSLERSRYSVSIDAIERIANVLKCEEAELLARKGKYRQ